MIYRREIDGLRAVAVIVVIAFHSGLPVLSGGFLGVDIFFVISGFLIYSIILKQADNGTFSFAWFYERRARRLAPALIGVIAVTIPFAWVLFDPVQLKDYGQSVACATFFCANFLFWSEADYFAHAAELKPLLHTWSLSVEEQFYLIFPFIALGLTRVSDHLKLVVCSVFLAVSFSAVVAFYTADPSAAFYLLHTRAWELLAGAICAVLIRHVGTPRPVFADLGLFLIVVTIAFVDNTMKVPGFVCVPAVVGACLILLFGSGKSISGRVLSSQVFVAIGLISYSVYLIHQPLLAFARLLYAPGPWILFLIGLLALPLGYLSWRFIELPFRRESQRDIFAVRRRVLVSGVALSAIVFVGFGSAMHALKGVPERTAPNGRPWEDLGISEKLVGNDGLSRRCIDGDLATILASESCRTSPDPEILLWGDSFAMHLAQVLKGSAMVAEKGMLQATLSQCSPILGVARNGSHVTAQECLTFNESVMAFVETQPALTHVVLSSPFHIGKSLLDTEGRETADPRGAAIAALRSTLQRIEAANITPVLVGPTPGNATDLGRCLAGNFARGVQLSRCDVPVSDLDVRVLSAYDFLYEAAGNRPLVDWREVLCDESSCIVSAEGSVFLYRDWGHFSVEGAQWVGRTLNPIDAVLRNTN